MNARAPQPPPQQTASSARPLSDPPQVSLQTSAADNVQANPGAEQPSVVAEDLADVEPTEEGLKTLPELDRLMGDFGVDTVAREEERRRIEKLALETSRASMQQAREAARVAADLPAQLQAVEAAAAEKKRLVREEMERKLKELDDEEERDKKRLEDGPKRAAADAEMTERKSKAHRGALGALRAEGKGNDDGTTMNKESMYHKQTTCMVKCVSMIK